jgi:hypothetical protein
MSVFGGFLQAQRDITPSHRQTLTLPAVLECDTKELALGFLLEQARSIWPVRDGYFAHIADVIAYVPGEHT